MWRTFQAEESMGAKAHGQEGTQFVCRVVSVGQEKGDR